MTTRNMSDKITAVENAHAAQILTQYMTNAGIVKPTEVDRQCLVSDGMTSSIVRGKTPYPTVRFMMRMAHGLGMAVDDLLGDGMPVAAPAPPEVSLYATEQHDASQSSLPLATSIQPPVGVPQAPLVSHLVSEHGAEAFQWQLDTLLQQLCRAGKAPEYILFSSTGVHTYRGKEHYAALVLVRKEA